jgi:DNA-binding IscR family transcriptional regulator
MVQMVDRSTQLENWVAHFTKKNSNKYCCTCGTLTCIITALIQKALDDIAISLNKIFVKVIAHILHATISNPIMAINR